MATYTSVSRYHIRYQPLRATYTFRGRTVLQPYTYPSFVLESDSTRMFLLERTDVGALDTASRAAHGDERLWWAIAGVNGVIDPEDLDDGQAIPVTSARLA